MTALTYKYPSHRLAAHNYIQSSMFSIKSVKYIQITINSQNYFGVLKSFVSDH